MRKNRNRASLGWTALAVLITSALFVPPAYAAGGPLQYAVAEVGVALPAAVGRNMNAIGKIQAYMPLLRTEPAFYWREHPPSAANRGRRSASVNREGRTPNGVRPNSRPAGANTTRYRRTGESREPATRAPDRGNLMRHRSGYGAFPKDSS